VWEANPRSSRSSSAGALVAEVPLAHTYPHCWRCKNPTLFRATEQWFAALDKQGLRERTLNAIRRDVQWVPPWGEDRIYNMIAHRPDWTLSRQRVWGVPIVAFYCEGCAGLLLDEPVIEHVARLFGEGRGIEEWYLRSEAELLPAGTRCPSCGGDRFRKETDILDVWFDSGCSHAAVLEQRPELHSPAEMYIEGSDQHRGWFHSSMPRGHGHARRAAVPERVDPRLRRGRRGTEDVEVARQLRHTRRADPEVRRRGAAPLGLRGGLHGGHPALTEILNRLADAYRRLRYTYRFLLGNLGDFDPVRDRQPYAQRDEVDRFILDPAGRLAARVVKGPTRNTSSTPCSTPCTTSARWTSRRSTSTSSRTGSTPRGATIRGAAPRRRVLRRVLALTRLMAPILTFTARRRGATCRARTRERAPRALSRGAAEWLDDTLKREWDRLLEVRREVAKALELARAAS
jgi:isoleucyl-tRNA synthetase